jgi:tripartite-type tricarboxylate transporter receptor subunit TctC
MKLLLSLCLALAAFPAASQTYPNRPVRVVVGFPPGGGTDILARVLSPRLSEYLGQPFVVENRPGAMNYSSAGSGTSQHLAGELFKARTGTYIVHIPYKGTAASLTAVIAGEVHFSFANVPAILGHVRSGRLKALAVLAPRRSDLMPDVPTMEEAGVTGVEVPVWYALLGPAALPRDIVKTLNDATVRAARSPDLRQKLVEQGADPVGNTPEEFSKLLREEVAKWAEIVRVSGAKAE